VNEPLRPAEIPRVVAEGRTAREDRATAGYSFQALAKWRMELGLPRRYEPIDLEAGMEEPPPSPDVIRQRCAEVQTAWSVEYRAMVWRGKPGEAYREGSE
jgi:hypothetical protein